MKRASTLGLLLAVLLLLASMALARSSPYELSWFTVDGGGGSGSGGSYGLAATAGQADAGPHSGGAYTVSGGFWGQAAAGEPARHRTSLPLVLARSARQADVIFYGGTVLTLEANPPQAQAIAVQGERILAVGSNAEILAWQGPGTQVIDLAGRTLLPGFVEGHTHMLINAAGAGLTLDQAIDTALSWGLTSLTEMRSNQAFLDELFAAEQQGRLRLRVNVFPEYDAGILDDQGHWIYMGVWFTEHGPILDTNRKLRIPGVKIFADGAFVVPRGCPALTDPYPEWLQAEPIFQETCFTPWGDLYLDQWQMNQAVADLQAAGFRVSLHAMGDRTLDVVLNAIANALDGASNEQYRHQIQHSSYLRPDQMQRYAELGIVAVLKGMFNTCDQADYLDWYGPERYTWAVNRYALPGMGLHTYSEGEFNWSGQHRPPVLNLWGLVTRKEALLDGTVCEPEPWVAEHAITVEQALRMLTIEPAYAVSMDNAIGSLKQGKFADLVILSGNPLTVAPDELKDLEVWMTMVGGQTEFCAPGHEELCPGVQ